MPDKPWRICSYPGCGARTRDRYCPAHKTIAAREYNQSRHPDSNRIYGRQWRNIRNLYISKHPICELCLAVGHYVPATEVHHKLPIDQGGDHSEDNLQALCKSCHSRITMTETRRNR